MPHQFALKRETKRQYRIVRRLGVPVSNARHKLQMARKESIEQIENLNVFLTRKHPTTGAITTLVDGYLNPLLREKKRLLSLENRDRLTELEIAELNVHIAGWNWLKSKWLPRKSAKKDFSFSAVMGHHKKHL